MIIVKILLVDLEYIRCIGTGREDSHQQVLPNTKETGNILIYSIYVALLMNESVMIYFMIRTPNIKSPYKATIEMTAEG